MSTHDILNSMASLQINDSPSLDNLPLDILLIIFAYLDIARSIASLGGSCKKLHQAVRDNGWRIFVRSHFNSLDVSKFTPAEDWKNLARDLTRQSRSWDRRAFTVSSLIPPTRHSPRGATFTGGRFRAQTVPCHIVVDARLSLNGKGREETVAWGAGEDVVVRFRQSGRPSARRDEWLALPGAARGFQCGKDDVTSISIIDRCDGGLLVGRASGDLQMLSLKPSHFGHKSITFQPTSQSCSHGIDQKEIQAIDTDDSQRTLAVITKDNALLYPLDVASLDVGCDDSNHENAQPHVEPTEALNLRATSPTKPFRFLRSAKFMGNGDLALGLTSSLEPLRYLSRTPAGFQVSSVAKMRASDRVLSPYLSNNQDLETVRSILPVNTSSAAGGQGSVVLSSYDDGTVRLQDLRTSSPIDTVYQDHFEILVPLGPLVSYGTERFIAGSARSPILKIFDFRWTHGYYHTDALPCGETPLLPTPKPPTMVEFPYHSALSRCDCLCGQSCRYHALARTDFYRPNCNVYLPLIHQSTSPIYSLAKSSDLSSTVYAGLAGEPVEFNLRDSGKQSNEHLLSYRKDKKKRAGYHYHESLVIMIETGDGLALSDVTKSQRMPEIRKQTHRTMPPSLQRMHRLDDLWM